MLTLSFLHDYVTYLLERSSAYPSFAVLSVDVSSLTYYEDKLSSSDYSFLLSETERKLRKNMGHSDILVSSGVGRYYILFVSVDTDFELKSKLTCIVQSLESKIEIAGLGYRLDLNIGVSVSSTGYTDSLSMLSDADSAKTRSISEGVNNYVVYSDVFEGKNSDLYTDLLLALKENQFFIEYQPQYTTTDRSVVGAEALIRWRHPVRGVLMPNDFLSVVADKGLSFKLDSWVLANVCKEISDPATKGVIYINVSPQFLEHTDCLKVVELELTTHGVAFSRLGFELVETDKIRNPERLGVNLKELSSKGLSVAIDDFGSGYSSLSYLSNLPVTCLKLDKSFIWDTSVKGEIILKHAIQLGEELGITLVIEGVETEEQLSSVLRFGTPLVQGYLLSKPVSFSVFKTL